MRLSTILKNSVNAVAGMSADVCRLPGQAREEAQQQLLAANLDLQAARLDLQAARSSSSGEVLPHSAQEVASSPQLSGPLPGCRACGQFGGVNLSKCRFCSACCRSTSCPVASHRRQRRHTSVDAPRQKQRRTGTHDW